MARLASVSTPKSRNSRASKGIISTLVGLPRNVCPQQTQDYGNAEAEVS